jgi:hypothetical protein
MTMGGCAKCSDAVSSDNGAARKAPLGLLAAFGCEMIAEQ